MEKDKIYLDVKSLSLNIENIDVIRDFTFSIQKGEIVAILGPSGCGKTSFLNILSGINSPSEGEILLEGKSILNDFENCSYMFQDDLLMPWRNIYDNVLLPLEVDTEKTTKNVKIAKQLLIDFGLQDSLKLYPNQLSGGMRRRAAFVRTLSINRALYLFDEPTAGLDYLLRLQLEEELLKFLIEKEKTAIFITHDIESAVAIADKILLFSNKPSSLMNIFEVGLGRKIQSSKETRASEKYINTFQEILKAYTNEK